MKKSNDEGVRELLAEIMIYDSEKYEILQELWEMIFAKYPNTKERVMYGGIMFSLEDDFGGIFVRKNHVSFEFWFGAFMKDPNKILEGTGKLRRHLKISCLSEIKDKNVKVFIKDLAVSLPLVLIASNDLC